MDQHDGGQVWHAPGGPSETTDASCRRCLGMRSILMQGLLFKGSAGGGDIETGEGCCYVWFG
ncbi:MAG TPA: hypothetical protein DF698_01675 [Candidatus Atribacteria bacterium]|nr:hypothetical protein [Candidatus Atribacteria bacterium]